MVAHGLYRQGKAAEAERLLLALLDRDSNYQQARVLLATIYSKTKRLRLAENCFEQVLVDVPGQFDSLILLSNVKRSLGKTEEALILCRQAVEAHPKNASARNALGLCQLALRDSTAAMTEFNKAIVLEPRSAGAYHNLGLAMRLRGDPFGAYGAFAKALEIEPLKEKNYIELYQQQSMIAYWSDAVKTLEQGARLLPDSINILDSLGMAYARSNDEARAEEIFRQVWSKDPGTCQSYAIWLQDEGRFEDSVALLKESLSVRPNQGAAYYALAEAKVFELDGRPWMEYAADLRGETKLGVTGRMLLDYALGKSYDRYGDREQAMRHFDLANEAAFGYFNEGRYPDHKSAEASTDLRMRMFSQEHVESLAQFGSDDESPIFIVGMIRSGTTLLNQILSSHPQIASAGELSYWIMEGKAVVNRWMRSGIDRSDVASLYRDYLPVLRSAGQGAARIIDKMPLNYEQLGIIHACFPKAKFLHIRRNPVDTCLSIYMTHFGGGPHFAYKQENIVGHYREYLRLAAHWRQILPADRFFELDYEDLIADRESILRETIDFLGLPWDEACLHHEKHKGAVNTPSRWQARQPLYASSVARWKLYEPWLGALLDLADTVHPPSKHHSQAPLL